MNLHLQGLMNAIVIEERDGVNAYDVCMRLKDNGLLVRPPRILLTHLLRAGFFCFVSPSLVLPDKHLSDEN